MAILSEVVIRLVDPPVASRPRMAETTNPPPELRRIPLSDLPEELVLDILLRLPPKSILRGRAVCKAWRCITTDRTFLLAHHGRQPSQRLLSFVRDVGDSDLRVLDYCVEAVDFRTREFRSVVRFTGDNYSSLEDGNGPFTVHAACDGLLLMSYYDSLYLCNPATRQWALVCPYALLDQKIAGLYVHGPSGEYRVLGYSYREAGQRNKFFINTVGSKNIKCITFGSSSVSMRKWLARGSKATEFDSPFLSHGKLHWLPHLNPLKNILVFDTVTEEFSWLPSPVVTWDVVWLLEMEGTLAMPQSPMGSSKVDLWVLQDYKSTVWVHKYHVELPVAEISLFDEYESWTSKVVCPQREMCWLIAWIDWIGSCTMT